MMSSSYKSGFTAHGQSVPGVNPSNINSSNKISYQSKNTAKTKFNTNFRAGDNFGHDIVSQSSSHDQLDKAASRHRQSLVKKSPSFELNKHSISKPLQEQMGLINSQVMGDKDDLLNTQSVEHPTEWEHMMADNSNNGDTARRVNTSKLRSLNEELVVEDDHMYSINSKDFK